ncbi:MAG TPA: AAA family ATPase, partial [Streptosporangiaceae bacterium]|nr:AAA family ATPase [Streptosporangiaceae bacterium]
MTASSLAAEAAGRVLADLSGGHRAVVVDSPPGAGKSQLVAEAAAAIAGAGEPVMVIAQTNEQVDDLVDRLASADPGLPVGRLSAQDYQSSPRVTRHADVIVSTSAADLAGCPVTVGTAAKWATVKDGAWPWAIVDEAYQMRSDMLLRVAGRFDGALFVGDPGQLDPFSTIDIDRWAGLTWDPTQSAVAVLLAHNPGIPVHRLPVSWRLPAPAVPVVAEAFYPFGGFLPGTAPGERRLEFGTRALGGGPADTALEAAARSGWALYELPPRHAVRTDAEAVAACTTLATRLLERGGVAYCERAPAGVPVTPDRIAIGTAHRDQAKAIRAALGPALAGVTVDTANRLQGREFDVTIVLHPLSGRRDATAFHLEAGRLCVLTSRHRHACIVVARAGIPELLDAHPSTEPVHLNVPAKFPDGWEA